MFDELIDPSEELAVDRLFPKGFAGGDVLDELAPEGWEQMPLLGCFHPSIDQSYDEAVRLHRNIEALRDVRHHPDGIAQAVDAVSPERTMEAVRREYRPTRIESQEELMELVGLCLWDVFSDNHDVLDADDRVADVGSFRGAGAFLDEYLTRGQDSLAIELDPARAATGSWAIPGERPTLVVIPASVEELAEHTRLLEAIEAENKATSVWRRFEAAVELG